MFVFNFILEVAPAFLTKLALDSYANELVRQAAIDGQVGVGTAEREARLNEIKGVYPGVVWDKNGKIQLGDEFTVTVSTTVNIGGIDITIKSTASGVSEVYWKNGA
jgi:hypothetical protein